MKKIAVLTSGGDAPGMNAAVRAVVRTACNLDMAVFGIEHGYDGLMYDDMRELNMRNVCDIIHRGGTKLRSARSLEFKTEEGMQKAIEICKKRGIEGIVVIGGDGSFRGARDLSIRGIPCVGVPGTIDNDIGCSDYTIGYDTCLNTIKEMVDRIRDTIESHDRCAVVEVMGRKAGHLTLNAGIAVGATAILVPEQPFDFQKDVIDRINRTRANNKHHFIIMVAEGIALNGGMTVQSMSKLIEEATGVETRPAVLAHVQRGGSPTVRDRVMASVMGNHAVHLLKEGIGNRVVVTNNDKVVDLDILEGLNIKKPFDIDLYNVAMEISL